MNEARINVIRMHAMLTPKENISEEEEVQKNIKGKNRGEKRYKKMGKYFLKVLSNTNIAHNTYTLRFETNFSLNYSLPGQFVNIKVHGENAPFFRRPFSISQQNNESTEIIFEVVGRGTYYLSCLEAGDYIDLVGPLGNGFTFDTIKSNFLLVGGGIGIPPLLFLAQKLNENGIASTLLAGFRSARNNFLTGLSVTALISTDDGTAGYRGYITDILLEKLVESNTDHIYGCGPEPMLKKVSEIADKAEIPCSLSVEKVFGCGTGICLGCIVESSLKCYTATGKRYLLCCHDGPVFDSTDINF